MGNIVSLKAGGGGHPNFTTQDGFQTVGKGALVKGDSAKQVSLVGQGHCGHLQFPQAGHQGLKTDGALKKAELAMEVEMDEFGTVHGGIITKKQTPLAAN